MITEEIASSSVILKMKKTQLKIKYLKFLNNLIETEEINSSPSNGLENFDFDEETPELLNYLIHMEKLKMKTSLTSDG